MDATSAAVTRDKTPSKISVTRRSSGADEGTVTAQRSLTQSSSRITEKCWSTGNTQVHPSETSNSTDLSHDLTSHQYRHRTLLTMDSLSMSKLFQKLAISNLSSSTHFDCAENVSTSRRQIHSKISCIHKDIPRDVFTSNIKKRSLSNKRKTGGDHSRKEHHGSCKLKFQSFFDLFPEPSSSKLNGRYKMPVQMTLNAQARRKTYSDIQFSLSQLTHIMRIGRNIEQLPQNLTEKHKKKTAIVSKSKKTHKDAVIFVPLDKNLYDFKQDFFFRLEEANRKRKSLRIRKRWLRAYRKVQSVLRISKNMAVRSVAFENENITFVDIGDFVTVSLNYGVGMSIDTEMYKRKIEISISPNALETLTSVPSDRTLVQLEEVRRELQKVRVFSEYPLNVQEHIIRRAFYLAIGPKRVILRQGHLPQNFFIIISGQAYVKKHVWDEAQQKVVAMTEAFYKTGDTFGSSALIKGIERTDSVISRTSMQLLAINGEDFLDLIFRRSLPGQLPPHIQYLSTMNFMENFPIHLLKERLSVCSLHHFSRNVVITHDSSKCRNLFIIKYGYCKVFRKLGHQYEEAESKSTEMKHRKSNAYSQPSNTGEEYIERDSPYVSYMEVLSPMGNPVRVPVTKLPGKMDKIYHQPLTLPMENRQFVPLMHLREGEVFGLDQTDMCPLRHMSRSTILVSLGAEVITLNKDFYCRHAGSEAREVVEKVMIYDDTFIRRRLRERVNRDVHLEEVLKFYFLKMQTSPFSQLPS